MSNLSKKMWWDAGLSNFRNFVVLKLKHKKLDFHSFWCTKSFFLGTLLLKSSHRNATKLIKLHFKERVKISFAGWANSKSVWGGAFLCRYRGRKLGNKCRTVQLSQAQLKIAQFSCNLGGRGARWMDSGHMGDEKRQNWKYRPRSVVEISQRICAVCIFYRSFRDSWIRSFLTALNASLSHSLDALEPIPIESI